jgi:hypothetical protein
MRIVRSLVASKKEEHFTKPLMLFLKTQCIMHMHGYAASFLKLNAKF